MEPARKPGASRSSRADSPAKPLKRAFPVKTRLPKWASSCSHVFRAWACYWLITRKPIPALMLPLKAVALLKTMVKLPPLKDVFTPVVTLPIAPHKLTITVLPMVTKLSVIV